MKKRLSFLIVLIFILSLCVSGNVNANEVIELTFVRTGTPEVLRKIFDPIIKSFEEKHPNIKINMQDLGWGDAATTIQTMAASKTLPDVMYHLPGTIFDLAEKGLILDLTNYLDEELVNDMYPSMLEAGVFNEKQYMITCGGMTLMMWYNTELFEKVGLDPDSPPKDWNELLDAAERLNALEDVSGIGMYGKAGGGETSFVIESFFTGVQGGSAWDNTAGTYYYNTPDGQNKGVEVLDFLHKLSKFAQPGVVEYGRFDCRTLLRDGKVGIVLDGVNMANQIEKEMNEGILKAALLPAYPGNESATAVNVGGWFIPVNSEHPDEAWTFLRFLMETENQAAHAAYGSVPILQSEAKLYEGDAYKQVVIDSVASSYAEAINPKTNALWQVIGDQFQMLLLDLQSPEETMKAIAEEHALILQ